MAVMVRGDSRWSLASSSCIRTFIGDSGYQIGQARLLSLNTLYQPRTASPSAMPLHLHLRVRPPAPQFARPSAYMLHSPSPPGPHYPARVIALIDYGSGNLRSVHKALLKVGADVRIARRPEEIGDARAVVLPGVGAFDDCIQALAKAGAARSVAPVHPVGPAVSRHLRRLPGAVREERGVQQLRGRAGRLPGQGRALLGSRTGSRFRRLAGTSLRS